ncbi:glycine zipper family protein [Marinilactibacillus sp. GCM10026970]|uniref:glycine zipper family protein n=1 Tax=Marinilactibacillus sp. GCM10026970 TaxID=3252642 RepID=UPI0036172115
MSVNKQKQDKDTNKKNAAEASSYLGVGLALGAALGILTNNLAIGIALGLVFGSGIGAFSYSKKDKKDK